MDECKNKDEPQNNAAFDKEQTSDNLQRLNKELQTDLDRIKDFIIKVKARHIEITNENAQLHATNKKLSDELENAKRLLEQK